MWGEIGILAKALPEHAKLSFAKSTGPFFEPISVNVRLRDYATN